MKTLFEIKAEVDRLAALIGAAGHYSLPTYGHTEDGARPHIEVGWRAYHLVVVERGQEQSRYSTHEFDDLLYHVFQSVTFILASAYEVAHHIENQDCRRMSFQRQVELLSQMSQEWGDREAQEHGRILGEYPFDDFSHTRARLTKRYTEEGHAPEMAWRLACARYPLPV